jgi:hypothetical protein
MMERGPEEQRAPGQASQQMLNGQQMQAIAAKYGEQLAAIKKDIELRKWVMDQACSVVAASNEASEGRDGVVTFHDPITLARAMHAFLVEGAGEKAE